MVASFLDATLVLGKAGQSHYSSNCCLSKMIEKETPEIKANRLGDFRDGWESRFMTLSSSVALLFAEAIDKT